MKARLSMRWLIGVVVLAGVVIAVWACWPSAPRVVQATGWQAQTDLPMLVTGPRGIVVDRNGDVYVAESEHIQRLAAGSFRPERLPIPELKSPDNVAFGPGGELYVGDYNMQRVMKISADRRTTVALSLTDPAGQDLSTAGSAMDAGIAVDRAGTLFATDPEKSRIVKLAAGSATAEVLATVEHLRPPIAVSDNGDVVVLVSDPAPTLLTFRGGKSPAVPTPIPNLKYVTAIAIDHRGNRLLADNDLEFSSADGDLTSTTTATLWRLPPDAATPQRLPYTDLGEIAAVTVDSSDTIYYTDRSRLSRVVRLAPMG
ncbi:hypothetical protein ACIA8C_20940 [Nocardia sp. NPDC051321]|uniref:hypothetical protein n=1 Tax=Nocardia sp. NPDC051321 TaxID=3364323 RepID=UPI003787A3D7